MFQMFSDLLQFEGTWDNYELKPNSFTVLSDGKMQATTSKVLQTPPFSGKIFSVQECSLKAVVYIPEAGLHVSKP